MFGMFFMEDISRIVGYNQKFEHVSPTPLLTIYDLILLHLKMSDVGVLLLKSEQGRELDIYVTIEFRIYAVISSICSVFCSV